MKVRKRICLLLCAMLLLTQLSSAAFADTSAPGAGTAQDLYAFPEDSVISAQELLSITDIVTLIAKLKEKIDSIEGLSSDVLQKIAQIKTIIDEFKKKGFESDAKQKIEKVIALVKELKPVLEEKLGKETADKVEAVLGKIEQIKAAVEKIKTAAEKAGSSLKTKVTVKIVVWLMSHTELIDKVVDVVDKIKALPDKNITAAVKDKLAAAKEAVKALKLDDSSVLKNLIGEALSEKLEKVEKVISVVKLIEALPTGSVTTAAKGKIEAAREAFNNLSGELKAKIDDTVLKKLQVVEALLASKEESEKDNDDGAAKHVEEAINTIVTPEVMAPEVTDQYKTIIISVSNAYNSLTETQKEKVSDSALKKLNKAEKAVDLEESKKSNKKGTGKKTKNDTSLQNALEKNLLLSRKNSEAAVSWGLVSGASKYAVYAEYTGQNKFEKVAEVSGIVNKVSFSRLHGKKLNKKKNLKVYVVVYKNKQAAAKSHKVYSPGPGIKKYSDAVKVRTDKKTYKVKVGKRQKIRARVVCKDNRKQMKGQCRNLRYVSLDPSIATVSEAGKIKGIKRGTCTIRVFAKNGCHKDVKVVVR